jgi:hypothetical protein
LASDRYSELLIRKIFVDIALREVSIQSIDNKRAIFDGFTVHLDNWEFGWM